MPGDGLAAAVEALSQPWRATYFEVVDSTQDAARAAAGDGAPHRSVFVADYQRAGRGRRGRSWLAEPGTALMLSVVFRDTARVPVPWRWTSLASVSLVEAIEAVVPGLVPAIKWPNDVMLGDRKTAGILAESTWDGVQWVAIVGVGINVNTPLAELASVGGTATSLKATAGQAIDRGRLLLALVERLDVWLARPPAELASAWQSQLWGRGQRLRLLDLGGEEDVVVLGTSPDGSLRVRLADGTERRTSTGELIQ